VNSATNKRLRRALIAGVIGLFVGTLISVARWEIGYTLVEPFRAKSADYDLDAIGWVVAILWTAPFWCAVIALMAGLISVKRDD
jgi:hypothetical protein